MENGKAGKGVFFKEAPEVWDFVNVVDSLFTPQLELMNDLFVQMNEAETMNDPCKALHGVVYGAIQTWEKICGEALKMAAEKTAEA